MSKLPPIERPYNSDTGLTGESAYLWSLFLLAEADFEEDHIAYDKYKTMVEQLQPKPGKAVPSAVHYTALEEAIKSYGIR